MDGSIAFEPGQIFSLKIVLASEPSGGFRLLKADPINLSEMAAKTTIDSFQVDSLPSAGNIWSLIENQDLSATTNRIDIGGMWACEPALWSSRGSVSWTQTNYLLNGMDVTDPYWRGMPLFHPDIFTLAYSQLSNARHPVSILSPGGGLDLLPKKGGAQTHGRLACSWSAPWMSATNISPRLEAEGLSESHRLNSFLQVSGQVSGSLVPDRFFFFVSLQRLTLDRDVAEFAPPDKANLSSGFLHLTYRSKKNSISLLWTGQVVGQPTSGAGRNVPLSSTLDRRKYFNVVQAIWATRIRPWHSFELGASWSGGNQHDRFQKGESKPHGLELFSGVPSGVASVAGRHDRTVLSFLGRGNLLIEKSGGNFHHLTYGFSLRQASSASKNNVLRNLHLHFFNGRPLEVVRFEGTGADREEVLDLGLFLEETFFWKNLASISFGIHLDSTQGRMARVESGLKIGWLNLSPRLAVSLPLTRKKSSWLKISAARYYFNLPLFYLAYGNPDAPGKLVYAWDDKNGDGEFTEDEAGLLLRREGPRYGLIDPDLKRPYTDEYGLSYSLVLGKNFYFNLAGFYRETRQLVETVNTGVPFSAYEPVEIYDPGDDTIPGNHDDLHLIVYNQKKESLGQDFFLLTNPDEKKRVSRYRGLDLTLVKKFSRTTIFFFSATATEAIGTTNPGNTEWENDDGLVGRLYDDPNASLSSRGRLRFDRAYTARVGWSFPFSDGFRLAILAKYYDGQPFARKIIIKGLNQGPFYVQAFYRGQARYEFNMTVDVRLEKAFPIGSGRGRILVEGFNIFNFALATAENEWTGPDFPLRFATEVQSPRHVRVGFAYEF
ncbi:MAG: carboxypeptidase regulatory-like domain-containing protein [Candidatus Aminicenantales bacterium]